MTPAPVKILPLVIADLRERGEIGIKHYGRPLTTDNGHNALQDAYEEALDMACYLRQGLEEQKLLMTTPNETPTPQSVPWEKVGSMYGNLGTTKPDSTCIESDGCPTERARLQREWRQFKRELAEANARYATLSGNMAATVKRCVAVEAERDELRAKLENLAEANSELNGDLDVANEKLHAAEAALASLERHENPAGTCKTHCEGVAYQIEIRKANARANKAEAACAEMRGLLAYSPENVSLLKRKNAELEKENQHFRDMMAINLEGVGAIVTALEMTENADPSSMVAEIKSIKQQLAEARKDEERLDWLASHWKEVADWLYKNGWAAPNDAQWQRLASLLDDLRKAIDNAKGDKQ